MTHSPAGDGRVLIVDAIHSAAERRLAQSLTLVRPAGLEPEQLRAAFVGVDAAVVRTTPLRDEVLDAADRLKVIAKHGTGVDNIDLASASRRGIVVARAGAVNAPAVAEYTLTAILLACKPMLEGARWLRATEVSGSLVVATQRAGLIGRELSSLVVGVVGWGAIGRRVGAAVTALGGTIIVHDPPVHAQDPDPRFCADLDELLTRADIVSIHVPLVPATQSLIGEAQLRLMKPTAALVNTSRGGVVDEAALVAALDEGRLRFAVVDVLEREPPDPADPLLRSERVLCTPHLGGSTEETLARMGAATADAVLDVLAAREPADVANPEVLTQSRLAPRAPASSSSR